MDFLNKLYESNYFGIGLFAVISFLVVTFLIVLFFGKRDEKKIKLEETNKLNINNDENTFKETTAPTPIEINPTPVEPINYDVPTEPIMPVNLEEESKENLINPIINSENIAPVAPLNYEEPATPIIEEKEEPIVFETPVDPIINEPVVTPMETIEPVAPINYEEPKIEPVVMEPTKYEIPSEPVTPQVMEPVRIDIPEESTPVVNEAPTVVDEPIIMDTYYKPVETASIPEVKVPNIDFDALAKSISDELDELEKSTPKVTPVEPQNDVSSLESFSSVYVDAPHRPSPKSEPIDLPKKIDLPKRIDE